MKFLEETRLYREKAWPGWVREWEGAGGAFWGSGKSLVCVVEMATLQMDRWTC
jgi:hypothetical protein